MEEWRPIEGTDGLYEVSSMGRVRSFVKRGKLRPNGTFLQPGIASHGYFTVSLFRKTQSVHALVAVAFLGPCPKGKEVCHKDGNRLNNHASNLRYATRKENLADRDRHGTMPRGEAYASAKLRDDAVREIRRLRGVVSQKKLAARFGVSPAAIQAIHDERTWTHVT